MENISKEFDKLEVKIYNCKAGKRYFDPVRGTFLCITPEETVRQKMIMYLRDKLGVSYENMYVEDHLCHYGIHDINGRIDISILENGDTPLAVVECKEPQISLEAIQVYVQATGYAQAIGARYVILVNGRCIQFYKLEDDEYIPVKGILSYQQMLEGNGEELAYEPFQRYTMSQYMDIGFLKQQEWYDGKIGADTDEKMIPAIMNLDDCFWDCSHTLTGMISDHLEVLEDLGVHYLNYGDASGSSFGSGYYRLFLINNRRNNRQFITGFSILATRKTVNDSKYGNRDGLTVLAVCRNDGDYDEISVQINLNRFLAVNNGIASFSHHAAVTRKGATKADAMDYIERNVPGIIQEGAVYLGTIDTTVPLYVDNSDVRNMLGRIIEYSIYRDEYKHSLQ